MSNVQVIQQRIAELERERAQLTASMSDNVQAIQQYITELEHEHVQLIARMSNMELEIQRLTMQLAESYVLYGNIQHTNQSVPFHIIFDQFPFPVAIYHTNGTLAAMNYQHKRLLNFSRMVQVGKFNVFQDKGQNSEDHQRCFREAAQGKVIRKQAHMPPSTTYRECDNDNDEVFLMEVIYLPIFERMGLVSYVVEIHLMFILRERDDMVSKIE